MSNIIIHPDNFVWLDVTEKSKEIYNSGLFELYEVYGEEDNYSDHLIQSYEALDKALENGASICIEVGFINQCKC